MKKFRSIIIAIVTIVIMFAFTACSNKGGGGNNGNEYVPVPGVYTHHEIAKWGTAPAAGKAEVDGDYIKIMSSTAAYGGVKSPSNADAITIDYSKQVYLDFKELSVSPGSTLLLKARVVGYNELDSAYVLSDDMIGVTGDFSLNLQDAFYKYKSAATNAEIIYKAGDVDLEGATGTEVIAEGDPRIGKLKFEGQTKAIKTVLELYVFNPVGGSHAGSFVRFKSLSVKNADAKTITSINVNQSDLTGDNAVEKGSADLTLTPVFEKADSATSSVIYKSSNPNCIGVTDVGVVSFKNVTAKDEVIKAISRGDVTKSSSFAVSVISNIKTAAQVKEHFDSITFDNNMTATDIATSDIIAGAILKAQNAEVSAEVLKAVKLYANANKVTVLNNYDASDADMLAEKNANGGKFKTTVQLDKGDRTWENATLSVYDVNSDKINRLVSGQTVSLAEEKFSFEFGVPYVDGDAKSVKNSTLVILWNNGDELVANRVEVMRENATQFGIEYKGDTFKDFFNFTDEGGIASTGSATVNNKGQLELKYLEGKDHMQIFLNMDLTGIITDKDVYMVIDIASMNKITYANIQYPAGSYPVGNVSFNATQILWKINLSDDFDNISSAKPLITFALNGSMAGADEKIIINSVRFYC